MTITLTHEQQAALAAAEAFLARPSGKPYFVLQGLAGTGKSTLLSHLAVRAPNVTIVAPTGKAAAVLRAKSGLEVRTIHSAIYNFRGLVEDEDDDRGRMKPVFAEKGYTGLDSRPVLMDESSMVGQKLAEDLLATGARVVACGDPGQLPPVKDRQFFAEADAELKTIHRQALESPIIRQAHRVRAGEPYVSDGEGFAVLASSRGVDFGSFDMVLCWRNATRKALNRKVRAARGFSGRTIGAGEPVMCLRNDYARGIFNGEVYTVAEPREPGTPLRLDGGLAISDAIVEDFDPNFDADRYDDEYSPFALAWAATAHKAQGSEYRRVLIFDEMNACDERTRWLYTAITRASEQATVVRPEGYR